MNLHIAPITPENRDIFTKIAVKPQQLNMIETISECLEEADTLELWRPVGIYDGETPVGFAMYGLFIGEGIWGKTWLDRFLIGADHQGKGYGRRGIQIVIDLIFDSYPIYDEIFLSVYNDNLVAIALYESLGFTFNGDRDAKGEYVMVLNKPT